MLEFPHVKGLHFLLLGPCVRCCKANRSRAWLAAERSWRGLRQASSKRRWASARTRSKWQELSPAGLCLASRELLKSVSLTHWLNINSHTANQLSVCYYGYRSLARFFCQLSEIAWHSTTCENVQLELKINCTNVCCWSFFFFLNVWIVVNCLCLVPTALLAV